tara:strand:- start:2817 stop:4085 length:1269 start_codon:yes stop_codon:yes gene_type:complete
MSLQCPSKILGECIQPLVKACPPYTNGVSKRAFNTSLNKFMNILYEDFRRSMIEINKTLDGDCFRAKVFDKSSFVVPEQGLGSSRFLPDTIRTYIETNGTLQLVYECSVNGRGIQVAFMLFSTDELENIAEYDDYVKMIYIWLHICSDYSKKTCSKTLKIYIYFTPMRKWLPKETTTILSAEHVNTAYTFSCALDGEMVIYRKEEWLKVFIHETFHSYGLDLGLQDSDADLNKKLSSIFPMDINFNVAETYTESWARIINCALYSFVYTIDKSKAKFYEYAHAALQLERLFSIYQMQKILRFMGLTYANLRGTTDADIFLRKNMYREDTAVFGYYVLGGIVMSDFYGFLKWCGSNNPGFIQFHNTKGNKKSFGDFIESNVDDPVLLKTFACIEKTMLSCKNKKATTLFKRTMRMSLIDQMCY